MRLTYLLCLFLALLTNGAHLAVAAPCNQATKTHERLAQGQKMIRAGESQRAITECFQPVIDGYEQDTGKKPTVRRYSAQYQVQAIIYVALPDEKVPGVEVMGGDWADAYRMRELSGGSLGGRVGIDAGAQARGPGDGVAGRGILPGRAGQAR